MTIEELEHDGNEYIPAIAPLGADPEHCRRCRYIHGATQAQDTCPHDELDREYLHGRNFAVIAWCVRCDLRWKE